MNLATFVCQKAIRADLESQSKDEAIEELISSLAAAGELPPGAEEDIVAAVQEREKLGSTGIGRGVAVPHAKFEGVDRPVAAIGISTEGIDFQSLDGDPVQLIVLLVSSPDHATDHIRALETVARRLRDNMFCKLLMQSRTNKDVWELVVESDEDNS